ncbi:Predicted Na+-dependent transporter [Bhargavaea ginsengi]|uniref:Predicted Na+-dependent transporter n=1 Tax=Bhargavaea ginsengi TaxID=426757 RepID=A0A1H7B9U1_9BACL|nr:bile acid:sodium symporter family protein [Bhargavaea ginsengi]SEJ74208.1 Predicted Na+-dependent transporter [Bhargavaea ginsengi]
MLERFDGFLKKGMPVITPLCLVAGVLLADMGSRLLGLVPWIFALMTFAGSLGMRVMDLKNAVRHPLAALLSLAFLHLLIPAWAYLFSVLVFDDHLLTIGFVLSAAVPTGVSSIIWVSIYRGNLALCLSIILIDTMLAPLIIPATLFVVAGQGVSVDGGALVLDLLLMVVLPSLAGLLLNEWTKGGAGKRLGPRLSPVSKLSIFAIVLINSSVIAPYLKDFDLELLKVLGGVLLLAASGYAFALLVGEKVWKHSPDISVMFVFNGGMRNIALGVVIATVYFPAKVALPVVCGMLFQQVLAAVFGKVIERRHRRMEVDGHTV